MMLEKVSKAAEVQEEEVGNLSQGIQGAPKAFVFYCLSVLYQSFFTFTIIWTSTGLCHTDFIFKICPSE